jgi:NAD(P)-dependent dehydrogenase (short-subunit alcohol dehydrogenase family)
MDLDIKGLRVLVTAGANGIGLAIARAFVREGARVHTCDVDEMALSALASSDPDISQTPCDVSDRAAVKNLFGDALARLGGLDVLVNNASSLGPVPLVPLADTECEDLELALATNLLGPFRLTKALLGSLAASARAGRHPQVINISSDAAITAYPNWGAYSASKAALHHLSRIWHDELAEEGVRVVSIDPGDMDTPLHALAVPDADRSTLKRPETAAQEIAAVIAA